MANKNCKKCKGTGFYKDNFIPFAGGSMGMGFPAAVGYALSKKLKGEKGNVYCLMSDGEVAIGTTWESALIASQFELDNLYLIIDKNGFQAMGSTESILDLGWLVDKFEVLGFETEMVNGHSYDVIEWALDSCSETNGRPKVIIAETIKGKGVSFMENENIYHYKAPNAEEYIKAKKELEWQK